MRSADSSRSNNHDFISNLLYLPLLFHAEAHLTLKAVAVWTRRRDTPMSHLLSHTLTHSPLLVPIRSSVKMLLLLLGIILLHIAALVLLFVSTIVSVSATCVHKHASVSVKRAETRLICRSADARVCVSDRYGRQVKPAPQTSG